MTFYVGVVDKSAEGAFGIWFPDLPGCTAMADTMDALFTEAVDVVRVWVETAVANGEDIPKARDLGALLDDPQVQDERRDDDASFLQVPLLLLAREKIARGA